ncbi:unnamed protein product [Aphanomyces euteiches]|uniref:Uncharacterized protein n=1 Tax=Aphanomyces euteiches TaxID=100861 RepID=A0A6G0XMK4_9STRA|nr:hypothetical protein Ae201684_003325 [Aphanomyces euteiches]KAH9098205.1 hypothetical protein Ae201684P_017422 [Aphanomyces euteiches]KAH9157710.1 hypothetical protein AeRB84_000445 [Aphanomyces euteiches]
MNALNYDDLAMHFDQDADEVDPYVVCEGVSVDVFNKYVDEEDESLRVRLPFLDLSDDGRFLIVDLATRVHESTKCEFGTEFVFASGNRREIGQGGSMTVSKTALPNKAADATYGPLRDTLNRTSPPPPRTVSDWVTLAVEYVLLLKVNANATELEYRLYDIVVPGPLPNAPTANGTVRRNEVPNPGDIVSFDMRRVLSIPADQALPEDVNDVANVNLRAVLNNVY